MERELPELMTPAEVAALFRVDVKTVTRWAQTGKLVSERTPGGHRRYHKTAVLALRGLRVPRAASPPGGPVPQARVSDLIGESRK